MMRPHIDILLGFLQQFIQKVHAFDLLLQIGTAVYIQRERNILVSQDLRQRFDIEFRNFDCPYSECVADFMKLYLSVNNNMPMDLTRSEHSNILMIGGDTDKARSMFAFAMLSLCINYRIKYGRPPEKPFIYLLNCKPLEDSYFTDIPKLMATELLAPYICNIPCWDNSAVESVLTELYENVTDPNRPLAATDKYFFVFGYQRAESLKSEAQSSSHDDVFGSYDMMSSGQSKAPLSNKKMMEAILTSGAEKGVHTIIWHDSYQALNIEDNKIGSYFTMKVAFDMSPEEFSRFVGANDISLMSENNAIYYNRARDNQKFRPYQAPDEEWLRGISDKLK